MFNIIKLNEKDNIGIAPMEIPENTKINFDIVTKNQIPFGHKISLQDIKKGSFIYKYGQIIGTASNDILCGQHVHSHNLIFSEFDRKYEIKSKNEFNLENNNLFFKGYKRENGKAGTRNYIGLISTVNCSATVVKKISENINIHLLENKFANIPPKLKKIKPKPPKYKGAFKSLVNHNEDQSITIPIDPKIINNNKPNTKTFFSGICSLSPFPLKSRFLGSPRL